MTSNNQDAIMLVYGEGGHEAEMKRLLSFLPGIQDSDINLVAYTEGAANPIDNVKQHVRCLALRDKQKGIRPFKLIQNFFFNTKAFFQLKNKWHIRVIMTTGPGIAIVAALLSKFCGFKVIHIETCCRFYSKSLTGRLMYHLADHFYVQNKELLAVYPKAVWCGRV